MCSTVGRASIYRAGDCVFDPDTSNTLGAIDKLVEYKIYLLSLLLIYNYQMYFYSVKVTAVDDGDFIISVPGSI